MTKAATATATEERYRSRQAFDRAAFSTHCVNCHPGFSTFCSNSIQFKHWSKFEFNRSNFIIVLSS